MIETTEIKNNDIQSKTLQGHQMSIKYRQSSNKET
jgi:hypothetical protein